MNSSNFDPSQNQMLLRAIVSVDDFLIHLTIPPVVTLKSEIVHQRATWISVWRI